MHILSVDFSPLGRSLIAEMNRIGMLVDISHTSDDTARQAIELSKAPVIWLAYFGLSGRLPANTLYPKVSLFRSWSE
jgi:hypothetical protein